MAGRRRINHLNPVPIQQIYERRVGKYQGDWAEITNLKHAQKPMFTTVLESDFKSGSRMIYRSQDGKRVFIMGEVREFVPPHRFVRTFRDCNACVGRRVAVARL
jgi:hypothetical protein